jgi:hypothetical protein
MDTAVSGTPRVLLRGEGLAVLIAAVVGYQAMGASWMLFAALLLLPDLGLLGYRAGPRIIWMAHIGMDRVFGLGLEFSSEFKSTHLGTIGRVAPKA